MLGHCILFTCKSEKKCSEYETDFFLYFKIDTKEEAESGAFSDTFCAKCFSSLKRIQKVSDGPSHRGIQRVLNQISKIKNVWSPFDENLQGDECTVCRKFLPIIAKQQKKVVQSPENQTLPDTNELKQCHPAVRKKLFSKIDAVSSIAI